LAEPACLAVALPIEEIGMSEEDLRRSGLRWIGSGYENPEVWIFKIELVSQAFDDASIHKTIDTGRRSFYGIKIAETWNGLIEVESDLIKEKLREAKILFRKITGKRGRLVFIGGQT